MAISFKNAKIRGSRLIFLVSGGPGNRFLQASTWESAAKRYCWPMQTQTGCDDSGESGVTIGGFLDLGALLPDRLL
jgi:hypothetical protein